MNIYECYEILGLPIFATSGQIRKRYLELVKTHHPDKNGKNDQDLINKITSAYHQLSSLNLDLDLEVEPEPDLEPEKHCYIGEINVNLSDFYHGTYKYVNWEGEVEGRRETILFKIPKGGTDGLKILDESKKYSATLLEIYDSRLTRDKNDLIYTDVLTLRQLIEGETLNIIHPSGRIISVSTAIFPIKKLIGYGMPYENQYGDLIFNISIDIKISPLQRRQILNVLKS